MLTCSGWRANALKHCLLTFVVGLSSNVVASADDEIPILDDPWRVYVGVFDASVNSEINFNGDVLPPGPPLDIEDLLGVKDSKVAAWGGVSWRFARRHTVEFEYFELNRGASESDTFEPPIQVGDFIIEAGEISTSYDTAVGRLTYGFSMIRGERSDLQLKAGLYIASLKADLGLAGAICDPTTMPPMPPGCPVEATASESEDVSAPLPHLGLSYAYAITPTVVINLAALGFAVELDNIDGSIIELDADVAWQPWRNVGFGLGLRYFETDVESSGSELNGSFNFSYFGPSLFVQATF
jgi:hypothetical protein